MRDLLATAAVVVIATPLRLLPWRWSLRAGRFYGLVAWAGWPQARRVAALNLLRAGTAVGEVPGLVRRVFAELGQSVAEGISFSRHFPAGNGTLGGASWRDCVTIAQPQLRDEILADPRPKVVVTAHLGSWEVLAQVLAREFGPRGAGIARRVDNPFLDKLVRRLRVVEPEQWIEKRGGGPIALQRLRQGDSVLLLLDENGGHRGVFVEVFGRLASTQPTAALLAQMSGARLVAAALLRTGSRGSWRLELADIPWPEEIPDPQAAQLEATARASRQLELWIRQVPHQWRWIHWRWRERPDGTSETYGRADLRVALQRARGA